jgi:hypothetical protein
MTIEQMTPYATNCKLNVYWTGEMYIEGTGFYTCKECHKTESPFEIIPLQPTGKENGWETEETERAAVTLETERAKWANP